MSEMIYGGIRSAGLLGAERFREVFILKAVKMKRLLPAIHASRSRGVVIRNRVISLDERRYRASGIIAQNETKPAVSRNDADLIAYVALFVDPRGVTDRNNGAAQQRRCCRRTCGNRAYEDRSRNNATAKKSPAQRRAIDPRHQHGTMRMLRRDIWIVLSERRAG